MFIPDSRTSTIRPKTEHIYMSSYEAKSREARLLEEVEGGFCLTDSF